ncbi:MAG: class II aldolase/adducin family protein [Candidatus Nitrosocosmicus sp.]
MQLNRKKALVNCVRDLYNKGFTSPVSGNHSVRLPGKKLMWITPSGVPRYMLKEKDLVKVDLENDIPINSSNTDDGRTSKTLKPSSEWRMHACIYNKLKEINAVVHTHSPYTLAVAISENEFQQVIEEARIIVGNPTIISNLPAGSTDLANAVSDAFKEGKREKEKEMRAVIIRNHGVVSIGNNIHEARAIIESLEEWSKILVLSKVFGGPRYIL